MKQHSRSIFNIFTLMALLVSLLGSAVFAPPVQAESPASSLSASDWAQVKALLPAAAIPDTQQAYLKASNTGASDYFGYSVSLSGNTLVVGAPQESSNATGVNGNQTDNSASQSGAVYVFTRSGTTWSQQAYLKASNTGADDQFGYAVSLLGDTLVVGAWMEDSNATGVNGNQANNSALDSGAVYVFTRTDNTWSQQAYLKASNTGASDKFGSAVALSGDTLVVGAFWEGSNATGVDGDQANNSATNSGAAYVFTRSGTTWSQEAYLKASNTDAGDYFGRSVSLSGDTIVVGAAFESSNATGIGGDQANNSAANSGAAYVFTRSGSVWSQQAYLKASNTEAFDDFGSSVSISGDTLVVGADSEASNATGVNGNQADNSAGYAGAAYVFTRSGSAWSQQAYLKASNTKANDMFGHSVSISTDMIVVGLESGAAYLFTRTGAAWSQQAYLKPSSLDASGDAFGSAVSLDGSTFVAGAWADDSNATGVNGDGANNLISDSGAAYVYSVPAIFTDVPYSYWANNYIERLYNAGITGGCGTGIYCPDSSVTRAQMAVFLLKGMHGKSFTPPSINGSTGFGDVATDHWAAAWIKQLAAEGITSGCGNGNYCPETTVTRAQMAVFLLKAKHGSSYTPANATGVFTDVPVGYWADKWIEQLAVEGVTSGCGNGNYCPDNSVTRAQMAVFLVKAFNLP